jgi:uncharacterized protein YjbI with pentapeptide repeats
MITLFRMDGTVAYVDEWDGATVRSTVEQFANRFGDNETTSGLDLRYADLRGVDLAGKKLLNTNFSYACLADANLRDANFEHSKFEYADLCGADLSRARLFYSVAFQADFRHTQLLDADFRGVHASQADFRGADNIATACWAGSALHGADFNNQPWPEVAPHEHLPFLANHIEEMDLTKHWHSLTGTIRALGQQPRTPQWVPSTTNVKKALKLLGTLIFSDAASNEELADIALKIPLRLHPRAIIPDPLFLLAVRRSRNKFHRVAATNAVHDMRTAARQGFAELAEDLRVPTDPEWYNRNYKNFRRRKTRANTV